MQSESRTWHISSCCILYSEFGATYIIAYCKHDLKSFFLLLLYFHWFYLLIVLCLTCTYSMQIYTMYCINVYLVSKIWGQVFVWSSTKAVIIALKCFIILTRNLGCNFDAFYSWRQFYIRGGALWNLQRFEFLLTVFCCFVF